MFKFLISLVLGIVLLLFMPGCTPKGVIPSEPVDPALKAPVDTKETWQKEWEDTLIAAKKEGKVVVYGSMGSVLRDVLIRDFGHKFGLSVEVVAGRGEEVAIKALTERGAGLYVPDVFIGGSTNNVELKNKGVYDLLAPLLFLPDLTNPQIIQKVWWQGKLRWMDREQGYILANLAFASTPLLINTDIVKPDEIKSYRDLLNPKWKGKIIFNDPTVAGTGAKVFAVIGGEIMGYDFIKDLVKHEIVVIRDQRLMVEWVAQGKKAILMGTKPEVVYEFIRAGAPLKYIWAKEGGYISSGTGCISLFNKAPHPKAAKLLINWFMSKEGTERWSLAYGSQSARLDVSEEGLDPVWLREPSKEYFISDIEDFVIKQPEHYKMAREIFGLLVK